jgi:hypothetical protein
MPIQQSSRLPSVTFTYNFILRYTRKCKAYFPMAHIYSPTDLMFLNVIFLGHNFVPSKKYNVAYELVSRARA